MSSFWPNGGRFNLGSGLRLLGGILLVVTLGLQFRLPGNVYPAEIALAVLLVGSLFRVTVRIPPRALVIATFAWAAIAGVAISVSSAPELTLRIARNASAPIFAFFVFSVAWFSVGDWMRLLKAFALCGTALAALGIHQAIVGYDASVNLFTLGMVDSSLDYLLGIVQWKLGNIKNSDLLSGEDLALGLHVFSNNFAEYMVYVGIALFGLRRARALSFPLYAAALILNFAAILLSGSRTSTLAWSALFVFYIATGIRRQQRRFAFISAATIVAVGVGVSTFFNRLLRYDDLGTVEGRWFLNANAFSEITSSLSGMVFGADIARYYEQFEQSPHNIVLFLWMVFGLPTAVAGLWLIWWVFKQARYAIMSAATPEERGLAEVALMGTIWFVAYGMTWSMVEDALSGLLWAFMASPGIALVAARRPQHVRVHQTRQDRALLPEQ